MPTMTPPEPRGGLRVVRDKPSLFDSRRRDETERDGPVSILAAMEEHAARTPPPRARRRPADGKRHRSLWLLLLVGLVLSVWGLVRYASPALGQDRLEADAVVVPKAAPLVARQAVAATPAPAASAAARIEEPVLAEAVAPGDAPAAVMTTVQPAGKPATSPHGHPASREKDHAVATKAAKATASATRHDADVDLMVALLDHMNGRTPARSAAATEVDERVRSCRQLGGQQATDCKLRACHGWWGRRAECPAAVPSANGGSAGVQ